MEAHVIDPPATYFLQKKKSWTKCYVNCLFEYENP